MDTRLMQQIKDILKEFPQYWNGEELQRPIVIDDLKSYDALLISALLKNQKIRENYSVKAGDVVIFKVQEFIDILRYKDYWADSYTKYSNTIGLSSEGKYLQYNTDVVLDFPYKDCVLEGGMTKEDVGKEEVFYNEVIARDEIDTLLAPKAFVNVKKYDTNGEHEVDSFNDEDNLIIKGNNLLALHSLKERYAGKVKLIYIDPPYNTGSDSFRYNDRFNHSTWLTFMKNRLQIARELLADDGVIAVHIDDNEGAYLNILLDNIFGRESKLTTQHILVRYAEKTLKQDMDYHKQIEQIHYYAKSKSMVTPNKPKSEYSYDKFIFDIETKEPNKVLNLGNKKVEMFLPNNYVIKKSQQGSKKLLKEIWASGTILDGNSSGRFFRDYLTGRYEEDGLGVLYKVYGIGDDERDYRYFTGPKKEGATKGKYYQGVPNDILEGNIIGKELPILDFIDLAGSFGNIRHEGGVELRSGKKPELMLKGIIETFSNVDDIVLDFFLGSGSTAATAMKMRRKFIGIEQITGQLSKAKKRLENVIMGDNTGISKDVDWQGGGSFIYAELMELNQIYMNKIDQAFTKEELADLWDELDNNADLNFQLDKEKLTNELLKEHDEEEGSITFNDLTFDEQKEIFRKALDKNQLYVPYSEIEDKNVMISDNDKAFNHSFYSNEGE
ncbi:site-specific DNA-methyltransferase [Enterococcus faecalis]|uniref:site-specific DNA-methyltransferase n=1 Tax=Enterococcus TaxID=1350 RepID=UPI001928A27B|nr:site-specific DNA-methyltransferase [Enterococcus faecalis]MDN3113017.1 site-specific DNA-methyltransferase [Enterococcus faecalis]HBC4463574.1 site-specific DNA-methyltransferase [Enterococcus faecalis]